MTAMEQIPLFDESVLGALRKYGQPAFIAKMIDLFLNTSEQSLAEIERCAHNGDWSQAAFGSHSLKSGAGNLGLLRLTELTHQIEDACRKSRIDQAGELIGTLRGMWSASCPPLKAYRDSLGA